MLENRCERPRQDCERKVVFEGLKQDGETLFGAISCWFKVALQSKPRGFSKSDVRSKRDENFALVPLEVGVRSLLQVPNPFLTI